MAFFSDVVAIESSWTVFLVFKISLRMTKSDQQVMFYNATINFILHLALYLKNSEDVQGSLVNTACKYKL